MMTNFWNEPKIRYWVKVFPLSHGDNVNQLALFLFCFGKVLKSFCLNLMLILS